jgi:hypothetical protein
MKVGKEYTLKVINVLTIMILPNYDYLKSNCLILNRKLAKTFSNQYY